jgi:outer membrane protein assembly factor BamD
MPILRDPRTKILSFAGLLVMSLSLSLGCSSTPDEKTDSAAKPISGTDEQIFVGDSLEMTYDPNVIMKRAEAFHEKESYAEAIVEYQHFLDLHRTHILAPYAQYRLALSHFKKFQTIDRDTDPLKKALEEFEELLVTFPGSRDEGEAKEKIQECRKYLAEHHLFVGNFYLNKKSYLAAAHRYELVNDTYPELDLAADAKLKLAKTYQHLGLPEWSRDWAIALVREHPQHKLRKDSLKLLADLQKKNPTLVVDQSQLVPQAPIAVAFLNSQLANPLVTTFAPIQPDYAATQPSSIPTTEAVQECALGSWCESTLHSTSHPSPQTNSLGNSPIPTKTCQPGEWC